MKHDSLLDLSVHLRYSSRTNRHISAFSRRERRTEKTPAPSNKQHLELLVKVWKKLPPDEKISYACIRSLHKGRPKHVSIIPMKCSYRKENDLKLLEEKQAFAMKLPIDQAEIHEIPYEPLQNGSEILCRLYIGNIKSANDESLLNRKGIYSVLSLENSENVVKYPSVKGGYLTVYFDITKLLSSMEGVVRFVDNKLKKGNVLVHCNTGNIASSTAAAAYIMKKQNGGYFEAIEIVRRANPNCKIEGIYARRLKLFEYDLRLF